MLRLAFDFIITWRETRTRPNAYFINDIKCTYMRKTIQINTTPNGFVLTNTKPLS